MTVPREDRLVRSYNHLAETESEENFDGDAIKPEKMVEQAQNVLEPYTFDYEVHDWRLIYTARIRLFDFC